MLPSPSKPCTAPALLRCFCNCTELTYNEVQTIAGLNASELLNHTLGLGIFKSFLRLDTHTARPICLGYVEHAELCTTVIQQQQQRPTGADTSLLDDLFEQCPNLSWERRLESIPDAIAGSTDLIEYCADMRRWLANAIQADPKWTGFQLELRKKLDKRS